MNNRFFIEIGKYCFHMTNMKYVRNIDDFIFKALYISKNYIHNNLYIIEGPIDKISLINWFAHHSHFELVEDVIRDNLGKGDYLIRIVITELYFIFYIYNYNESAFSKYFIYRKYYFKNNISLYEQLIDELVRLER